MLSKKVEYGLISVLYMSSLDAGAVVSTKDLAERYHLPSELLGKVLQALARSGMIEAVQGAKGGYRMNRALATICLGDVIECIEGPVKLTRCVGDPGCCDQFHGCNIKEPLMDVHRQLQTFIHGLSLGSLQRPAEELVT